MNVGCDTGKNSEMIRIGSRNSQLALIQTNVVVNQLKALYPARTITVTPMSTTGDKILEKALSKIGEKSLFTKELEVALADNVVDLVVHSLKDLPTTLPPQMVIGAVCKREDPSDAVVLHPNNQNKTLATLHPESVIGTSSLRRIAQLRRRYPHLLFQNITLPPEDCMHAVGQGALAVEVRANDRDILDIVAPLTDRDTVLQCIAERSFLKKLEGGCSVPVGVYSCLKKGKLSLQGGVFSLDGSKAVMHCLETDVSIQEKDNEPSDGQEKELKEFCGIVVPHLNQKLAGKAFELGLDLANYLLEKGAKEILDEARKANEASDTL